MLCKSDFVESLDLIELANSTLLNACDAILVVGTVDANNDVDDVAGTVFAITVATVDAVTVEIVAVAGTVFASLIAVDVSVAAKIVVGAVIIVGTFGSVATATVIGFAI